MYMISPLIDTKYMFHSKSRGNTTIKFKDGSSVTVKRAKGEKEVLETALAYAIAIRILGNKTILKKLSQKIQEVD